MAAAVSRLRARFEFHAAQSSKQQPGMSSAGMPPVSPRRSCGVYSSRGRSTGRQARSMSDADVGPQF